MKALFRWVVAVAVVLSLGLVAFVGGAAQPQGAGALRAKAQKLQQDGNYLEALEIYSQLVLKEGKSGIYLAQDVNNAVYCYQNINRLKEVDAFLEDAVKAHGDKWQVLKAVAEHYLSLNHNGSMVAGKFERGPHRGQAKYANSFERDRVRSLQLFQQALKEISKSQAPAYEKSSFMESFAGAMLLNRGYRESWRLQYLTDLSELPDYEVGYYYWYYGSGKGAPVDADGNPVFHYVPESFKTAKTDGERWRWLLEECKRISPARGETVDTGFAQFLLNQFGVQTMAYYGRMQSESGKVEKDGPYSVHTLKETETIAKLATGIKRFNLPDEFNYIKIYQRLAKEEAGESDLDQLATIFENRRQYSKAADILRQCIKRYGPGYKNARQKRLERIVKNWGVFERIEPQAAGKKATVEFRFRNATNVTFDAYEIKVPELLRDVKDYLKANPKKIDWWQVNLNDLGYRLVTHNQTKYIGRKVANWDVQLKPLPDHFDKRVTVETPLSDRGAYLLTATLPDGNISRIIIWLSDTVIVNKPLDKASLYYVADAVTGKPLPGVKLDFFGYRQKYLGNTNLRKVLGRRYDVETVDFTAETDENGLCLPDPKNLVANTNWLITASDDSGRLAFLGFTGVWYGRHYDYEYNQTKVFTITDRPVYRPGDKVDFKFWVRHAKYDRDDVSDFASKSFLVIARNPKGEEVFKKEFKSDEYGGLAGKLTIPKDATLGVYSLQINGYGSSSSFRVEEYKKPEFEVKVEAPKEPVALGDVIPAKIEAKYYFGAPVVKAKVKYKVLRYTHSSDWYPPMYWDWFYGPGYWWFAYDYEWYPGWRHWGCERPWPWWFPQRHTPPEVVMENTVPIGPDGTVEVKIDSSVAKAFHGDLDHRYEITAEVVDESRRTIVGKGSVIAAREPFKVYSWVNRGFYRVGETVEADFAARTVDGKPVQGQGVLKLIKIDYDKAGKPTENQVQQWNLATGEEGRARQKMTAASAGQYRLSYSVKDSKGHVVEGGYIFSVYGHDDPNAAKDYRFNALELIPDKTEYAPGEKVNLLVNAAKADSTVLLFVRPANGVYLKPRILRLQGKSVFDQIDVIKKDMPNFFVEALTVADGRVHTLSKEIIVPPEKRVLNVELMPSEKRYKPGAKAKVRVRITDFFGKPITSSTVLSIYDKAVEYISGGSNVPEIKTYFWKWRRHHREVTSSSLQKYLHNLLKAGEETLRPLGVFGHIATNERELKKSEGATLGGRGGVQDFKGRARKAAAPMAAMVMADSVDKEMTEASAEMEAGAAAPGGDDAATTQVTVRTNFADTAFWASNVTPDANGEAEIELTMPENLTTWKIKAWSMAHGTKVGQGETEVITSKDFIIRLQAPRFFVETDEVVLSANVHNYLPVATSAKVILELGGGTIKGMDKMTREVQIDSKGETRVDWRVKVLKEGQAVITMKAIADADSDAMQMTFPVYVHGIEKQVPFSGNIRDGRTEASFTIDVPAKRRPAETVLEVRYSPTLAMAMVDALPYLSDYPYGCTEQTLNRFLPTVITQKVLKDMGIDLKQVRDKLTNLNAQEIGKDRDRAKQWERDEKHPIRERRNPVWDEGELNDMVNQGLKRLQFMQLSDGGWGWFSGYHEYSYPHTTAVVVHGLQVAATNGVKVDPNMLKRGIAWLREYQASELVKLKNKAKDIEPFKTYADNIDALVYMVLVDADQQNKEMMDFLYRDRNHLSVYAKSMFGLALNRVGEKEKRDMIIRNIEQYLVEDDENQTAYLNLQNTSYWWYWYGSEFEAHAYYLKLLAATDPKGRKASRLVKYLLNNRKHATYWNSTRDTAYCLEAFADFIRKSGEDKPDMTVEVVYDGKVMKEVKIDKNNLFTYDNKLVLKADQVADGKHKVELRRKGTGPLYFNAYLSYFSLEDFITKAGLEVKVERQYYKLERVDKSIKVAGARGQVVNQKVEKYKRIPLKNLDSLKSGDLCEIELVIQSKNDYEYLIFEDMKAAGFEPVEVRSGYNGNEMGAYVEFRDAKVCFFVRRLMRGKHSLSYRMRAEIPGKFSALPTKAYAMYAPELRANSDEIKLNITD